MIQIIIANIMNFLAGCCSIISTQGKNKKQIVFIEFIGSILRILTNILVRSWSDMIAKIIKSFAQILCLENKLKKNQFYIISLSYIVICSVVTYISKDLRCIIAIIPTLIEFYSLLVPSTKKYRYYTVITKLFWIINNLMFQLYIGIIFDAIVIVGHMIKINATKEINNTKSL